MSNINDDFLYDFKVACSSEQLEALERFEVISDIIEGIIKVRKVKGISQKELSELTGINLSTIVGIEMMRIIPSLDTLVKITNKIGVKIIVISKEE